MTPPPPSLRTPVQKRSLEATERVLSATLRLLETRPFDELTMQEILAAAGQSVGRFYGRFANKEALFTEICRRFEAGVQARLLAETEGWSGRPLAERVRGLIDLLARLTIEHRPVVRSLLLRAWGQPGRYRELLAATRDESFERLVLDRLGARRPEAEVRRALDLVAVACREKLLFGELATALPEEPRVRDFLAFLAAALLTLLSAEAPGAQR